MVSDKTLALKRFERKIRQHSHVTHLRYCLHQLTGLSTETKFSAYRVFSSPALPQVISNAKDRVHEYD